MEQLKVSELKKICKDVGVKGCSTLKKHQLLEKMRSESIYDLYLIQKKQENERDLKLEKIKDEKKLNLQDFNETIQLNYEYNEDESDTEDSVCEDDFEVIYDNLLIYGDYYGVEDKMNEKESDKEKKEFLISTGLEDINEKNYRFGNSLQFSQNRAHGRYYIGKNDKLIVPDMFGDGDLVVPYEITKFNKSAVNSFDMDLVDYIYLRHDDLFVKKHIPGKIYKKWNWKIMFDNRQQLFDIELPNGKSQLFNKNTHVREILLTFSKFDIPKIIITASIEYDQNIKLDESTPLLPSTWKLKSSRRADSPRELTINSCFIVYKYEGPEDEKEPMEVLLKKSYNKDGILLKII